MEKIKEDKSYLFERSPLFQLPYSTIIFNGLQLRSDIERYATNSKLHLLASSKREAPSHSPPFWIDSPKPQGKRRRMIYTEEQTHELCEVFSQTRYPSRLFYNQLSQLLSIPVPALKIWFKNRRARCKYDVTQHTRNVMCEVKSEESSVGPPSVSTQPRMYQYFTSSCNRCQPYLPLSCSPQRSYLVPCQPTYHVHTKPQQW